MTASDDTELTRQLTELRQSEAPLFEPAGRGLRGGVKRLLNVPIRIFGRRQAHFNARVLDALGHVILEQERMRQRLGAALRSGNGRPEKAGSAEYRHDDPTIRYDGDWRTVPLTDAATARLADGGDGCGLAFEFEGSDVSIFFWSHPWSGCAFVEVDGVAQHVDLYSSTAGFREVHVGGLPALPTACGSAAPPKRTRRATEDR
jgi:hypothetical protein